MKDKPFVSILMPVYNPGAYLAPCLASILAQSYTNWELIAVDDFSTDGSFEVLKNFALSDTRIKVLKNLEKGILPALSLAFTSASGELITRMDADDKMPVHKLGSFVGLFGGRFTRKIVTGKVTYFSEEEVSVGYRRYEEWLNSLVEQNTFWPMVYRECIIASPNWMVHRSCFEKDLPFETLNYPEDYDMVFHWYRLGYEIIADKTVTHFWREHPKRTSRHVVDYQQEAFFRLKTNWFLQLELGDNQPLQLIGAGKKGKLVAAQLKEKGIAFSWFDMKAKLRSINTDIIQVNPLESIEPSVKTILTVWPTQRKQQDEVLGFLKEKGIVLGENAWLF